VPFPSGIHPWKNGVLVSAAPDIFFAADTDGDGKADVREVLYTGFAEGNQQHRVNGFTWGLDGWLYLGNGDSGGTITSAKTGKTLDIRGRDLRIHPETGGMEAVNGQTQFGRARDDFGHWFGNNNSRPMWQYVLEDRYLSRNPHIAPPDTRRDVSEQPGPAPVYPASKTLTRFNDFDRANRFTSACSAMIYRDELFGEGLRAEGLGLRDREEGSAAEDPSVPQHLALGTWLSFVSEPVHNLVHREIMSLDGVRYTSRRADDEQESEFLASTDKWFRPTQLRTGPDGALWIADMYRLVIEHPQWIPQEWQEKLDVRAGADKGRLWRVFPTGAKLRPIPRLDTLTSDELVAALDSPSGWQRDVAQQLLIERLTASSPDAKEQPDCFTALARLVREASLPETRVQALSTLSILHGLTAELLSHALQDPHPGVRASAISSAEPLAKANPPLQQQVEGLVNDRHAWVQLQLAATLGELPGEGPARALQQMLMTTDDAYIRAMGLSSVNEHNLPLIAFGLLFMPSAEIVEQGHPLIEALLTCAVRYDHLPTLEAFASTVVSDDASQTKRWHWSAIETWLNVQRRSGRTFQEWLESTKSVRPETAELWQAWLGSLPPLINDVNVPPEQRAAALRLFGRTTPNAVFSPDWLKPTQPPEFQRAALEFAGRLPAAKAAEVVVAEWPKLSPGLRGAVREYLLGQAAIAQAFLAAVSSGPLTVVDVDPETEQFLRSHRDGDIRQFAESVLRRPDSTNRAAIVAEYLRTMPDAGNAAAGRELFSKRCAQCHKLGDLGHAVGPDLASLTDKSVAAIVAAVLDPNRAVEAKFLQFGALTTTGKTHAGILTNETATSVTFLAAEAKAATLLRNELEDLWSINRSLMPEGLEKELSPSALADLAAFIRGNVPLPTRKTFPGNQPQRVAANSDGVFVLTPATCEIYGPTIILEEKYGNLGWWSSADDVVTWTLDVPASGRYRVEIEYACDPQAAGHRLIATSRGGTLTHKVTATDGWDDYRTTTIGEIDLPAGVQALTLKPASRPLPALLDLKGVRLAP
ncbi:MAG: c-type cytochrome, partial [Planctomycetaceae bacterium]|nr:c-type cytochrome [Planctomycetaceae bacterium]